MNNTINEDEIKKFSALADKWWDPSGEFKTLHQINPIRINFIIESITKYCTKNNLSELNILDIGCGGGLLSEPLASLGANLVSIDPSIENISVAKLHAQTRNISIDYRVGSVNDLTKENDKFEVILCMEVIEHVDNLEDFVGQLSSLLKERGILILSTINRTVKSFILAIGMAEYVLGLLPRGTHNWSKLIKPHEIYKILNNKNLNVLNSTGLKFNYFQNYWYLDSDLDVNYFMIARKDF